MAGDAVAVAVARPPPTWGEVRGGVKVFPLHAGQSDVLRSTARFTAAIAGTGGGKTAVGPVWVIRQIQRVLASRDAADEPVLGMVVAPTYPILQRATAPHLVSAFKGTDLEGRYVPTANKYYLPRDMGIIWVLSADHPGGLEGGQFDFVWGDEAGQFRFDAWVAIQGRTGQRQAPVLFTTTPYGQNWLFHQFVKRWKAGDKDYYVRQWSSHANPAYPPAEYERARRTMAPQRFAMRYDGEFVKRAGLVYPDLERCVVDPAATPVPAGELIGGLDWGWNDPFAALAATRFVHEDGRDVLYVWYERYKRFTPIGQHAAAVPPGVTYYADPGRPENAHEFRRAGHAVRPGYNPIDIGVDAVSARIYSDRLWVSSACRALLAEAGEYAYPEKDDETRGDKPVDEFNHALDALRYLVCGADKYRVAESGRAKQRGQEHDDGRDDDTHPDRHADADADPDG